MEVKLSSPWVTYYRKLEALFGADPAIKVVFDEDDLNIKLYVDDADKADALSRLLPPVKDFGNVNVKVTVIPANGEVTPRINLVAAAFKDNPALSYIARVPDGIYNNPINYVVFKNKVVQFYNDQLDDVHGNVSTLYETIAEDVLGQDEGVYFCTDIPEMVACDCEAKSDDFHEEEHHEDWGNHSDGDWSTNDQDWQ